MKMKTLAIAVIIGTCAISCKKEKKEEETTATPPTQEVTLTGKISQNDQNYAYGSYFIVTSNDTVALDPKDGSVPLGGYVGGTSKVTGTYFIGTVHSQKVDLNSHPKLMIVNKVSK